jgi:heme/copper-type cytochrome/quinol oxidase subunit 3
MKFDKLIVEQQMGVNVKAMQVQYSLLTGAHFLGITIAVVWLFVRA